MYVLLILYKRKLDMHKIGYFSTINRTIEKQANIILINTYPRFPPFLLYFRCKFRVTFARRFFRDVLNLNTSSETAFLKNKYQYSQVVLYIASIMLKGNEKMRSQG